MDGNGNCYGIPWNMISFGGGNEVVCVSTLFAFYEKRHFLVTDRIFDDVT